MPQGYRIPSPRRCGRKCMEGPPLRSTRLLPRVNGRMASLGYCQSESYPTFHFSALPLPTLTERAVVQTWPRHPTTLVPCFILRLAASCTAVLPVVSLSRPVYAPPGRLA